MPIHDMLRLTPCLKPMIWGGGRLGHDHNATPYGEAWLLSNRPEGMSIVADGDYAGMTLDELLRAGAGGTWAPAGDAFPLLVKFLDTGTIGPSIQVHPDDTYAQAQDMPRGKSEMWIITHAEPDSYIWYGPNSELSPDACAQAITEGTICNFLRKLPVCAGDVIFLPAGTIHGTGPNISFYEVQQNSNTTYRLYDFGRIGIDGKPRELHVEHARHVAQLTPADEPKPQEKPVILPEGTRQLLRSYAGFSTWRIVCDTNSSAALELALSEESFVSLIVMEGQCEISLGSQNVVAEQGQSWFIPAQMGNLHIRGNCSLLEVRATHEA